MDSSRSQINRRRRVTNANWWQMIPARMSSSKIVPVLPDFQDVVQLLLAYHAERVERLVLERLDDAFDERLKVWRHGASLLDLAYHRPEYRIERSDILRIRIALNSAQWQPWILRLQRDERTRCGCVRLSGRVR